MTVLSENLRRLVAQEYPGWGGQTRAADACGMTRQDLQKYLDGTRTNPSMDVMQRLCAGLGCTFEDLTAPKTTENAANRRPRKT